MRRLVCAAMAVLLANCHASESEPPVQGDPWAAYRFVLGNWVGEGSGRPGQGTGEFSFAPELQGKILVRKNRAEYPAAGGRKGLSHEDLLIVYQQPGGKAQKAIYFDSEGHVIHYTPSTSSDGKTLTFLGDVQSSAPRFRLTYVKQEADRLTVKFDMAPPGKPEGFRTYLEGTVHKK